MSKIKVAVLGSGVVGDVLAKGFQHHGYDVKQVKRDKFAEASAWCDMAVLAVKGTAAESAVALAGPKNLAGKTVIDATNPIAEKPPVNGVLQFFTDINFSLMERSQKLAPDAHFVKAFSCVGSGYFVNPQLPGGKPTMFICGNHDGAKKQVREILTTFGWETEDMGPAECARAIEPLCMLWCIPGLARNQWTHAFKLLKQN